MHYSQRFLIFYLLLFILNSHIDAETVIDFPLDKTYYIDASPSYITININNYDEISSNEYLHISTSSNNKKISPLIIFSSTQMHPSIQNSDLYSTQKIGDSHLILGKTLLKKVIYLTTQCNISPCEFTIKLEVEKNPVLNPGQIFSYFHKSNEKSSMSFKIPSQTYVSSVTNKSTSHILNLAISYSNSNSVQTELYLKLSNSDNQNKLNENYNMGRGIIYSFIEEDLIISKGGNIENNDNYYILNIISENEQYITISINSKETFEDSTDIPKNKITPNKGGVFSYLKSNLLTEECYSIYTELDDYSNSLVFASINFYSKPVNYYFTRNNNKGEVITPKQNSINVVLEKDEYNIYNDICFVLENSNNEGVFKIEISETNDKLNMKNIYDPLKTGSIYKKSLHKKGLTYYTHNPVNRTYSQMNFNLKVLKGRVEMFVVRCDTFPECSYTYDKLLEESKIIGNNKIIKPHIINDMYSYSGYVKNEEKDLSPYNYKQNLMFVYCSEESKTDFCQYEISFFTEKDKILLLNNDKFYQYMLQDEIDVYQVHIPKLSDSFSKVVVILYTFTGDASYQDVTNKGDIEINIYNDFIGGKKVYEYTPSTSYPINEKDLNIEFNIKAVTNCYYEVEYKIIKESYDKNDLENNIFYNDKYTFISTDITFKDSIKYIAGDDVNNKRYFAFQNNRIEENNPYLVQIFSMNCKINVKRGDKLINESDDVFQDLINNTETYYQNKYYLYETNIVSIENYGEKGVEHQCIIYLSGQPLDRNQNTSNHIYNNKILLTENEPHQIILANDTKSYRYLFPYLGNSSDIESYMLVHINFDAKMSINAKFYFDESDLKKNETMGRSGQILLSNKLIKENCKDIEEICNVIIEINFNNVDLFDKKVWSSPNFQLFVSTNNKIPSYLKNGELRLDSVVKSNPLQYFYTDISMFTQGQVIINTKRGEGVIYAKLYEKGKIDEDPDWGNIKLPDDESKDILRYDHYTHSVHFEKDHTRKCGLKGCLLLITYENVFSPSKNKDYLIGFSILTRLFDVKKTSQSIVDIPLRTYVYGAIEKNRLSYNYFKVYIPEDSEQIDFEVQCETCILYINRGEKLPTPESHDSEYFSQGKVGVYSLSNDGPSIKDTYYTFRIESPVVASQYVTTYSLRVMLPTPSNIVNYNIIPVDSDQNANCNLDQVNNDGICYFIVYIDDDKNNITEILAHVYTDIDLIDLEINANFIPKDIAERAVLNEMMNYLPESPKESTFSTENEFYSDYLLIDLNQRKNNDYIIFGVTSSYSATVTFLSTFYTYEKNVMSNPNTVQLMKMNSNSQMRLNIATNNYYLVYLYSLYGTGEISWKDLYNNERTHKLSEHELFSFTSYVKGGRTIIKSDEKKFAFYLWQDVRDEGFLMNEMDFNTRERFIYTQSSLPLNYFCVLPLLKKNKKILFEDLTFNIELYSPDKIGVNKTNNLIIEGTIINMKELNTIKKEQNDESIKNIEKLNINFDLSTNSAFIILDKVFCENIWNKKDNKDGYPYLYISIRQKETKSEEKDLSDINGEIFVTFRNNSNYVIPQNQTIRTKIDFNETGLNYYLYSLQLDGSYNKNKIILDISTNTIIDKNGLLYSLIDSNQKILLEDIIIKNSSNIKIDDNNSKVYGGKYHIEFALTSPNAKGIDLCLFSNRPKLNSNELRTSNVLFKYFSYEPTYQSPKYDFDNKVNWKYENDLIILNMMKIKKIDSSNTYYPNTEFIVRKILYENKLPNEELSSIILLQSIHEILYTYKDNNTQNDAIELKIPYKTNNKEKYYLSVIANLYDDKEKFSYNTIELEHEGNDGKKKDDDKGKEKDKTNKSDNTTTVIIIIVLVVIVVIICFILLYLFVINKKMTLERESLMQVSFNDGKGEPQENNVLYENQNENQLE